MLLRRPTVFFLHIPKCGGTTLVEEVIRRQFSPSALLLFYGRQTEELIARLSGMSRRERARLRCVAGHFAFGVHRFLDVPRSTYITLLRDPVKRVISHYAYVRRTPGHYLHRTVVGAGLSLREYVERDLSLELENGQTRLLAGITWGAGRERPSALLEQAKANLASHFSVVGVIERYEGFLVQVHDRLRWRLPVHQPRNVAPEPFAPEALDAATVELIEEKNRLDRELHTFAQNLSGGQHVE
jgi:hypothetical protein